MENRRRIGNDYTFTWPFEVRTGEQTTEPYDLTGRVFQLYMVGQLETFEIAADEVDVDGNEITWTWHGKDQRYPGLYNAKLIENGGEDGMITVDVKYAVTLVPHTWQEGGSDDGCISLESVELVATEVSMTPGPRGPQGEQGPAGPQGETGPAGPQGAPGTAGPQGPEGKSAYEVAVENGFEGTEEEWLESLHGGPRGPQGYSAYEVAVNEGYVGTETEWLASLKGETGATGATGPQGPQGVQGATGPQGPTGATGAQGQQGETGPQGPQGETGATGATGPQGKSAYQVAVDNGYSGTEAQWLASLKGETGATGPQGPKGDTGETGATGPQGETGATGPEGPKGDTGDPGITSASVSVDANTGTPSVDASIANKVLTLAFHNLKGAQGPKGDDGDTGATGPAGERGGKWLEIASTPTAYTTQVGDFLPSYRVSKSAVLTQAGVDDVIVGDILVNSYYVYGVGYVDDDYVYTTARASIRGATGGTGSAATIAVGTVTTGAAGSSAAVTNRGSSSAAVFDFTIPKGDKGDTGATGAQGPKGDTGATGPQGPTGPAGPSGTLNTDNATAQAVNASEALSGAVNLHKIAKTGSYNDLLDKPSGGGTEHNLKVSPNSVFYQKINGQVKSTRIFPFGELRNATAIIRSLLVDIGNISRHNAGTVLGFYKSENTYLEANITQYNLIVRLVVNGSTVQTTTVGNITSIGLDANGDYAVRYNNDDKTFRFFSYSSGAVTNIASTDISSWDLSSLDNVYLVTSVNNFFNNVVCNTVLVNCPSILSDYIAVPMNYGYYNVPQGTSYDENIYLAGQGLTMGGTVVETISATDKIIQVSNASLSFFSMGPSNLDDRFGSYHLRLKFNSVGSGAYFSPTGNMGPAYFDNNGIATKVRLSTDNFYPVEGETYDMYYAFEGNNAQSYQRSYAMRVFGDLTFEVSQPYMFNKQIQNLCAETYNGDGFTGAIPSEGDVFFDSYITNKNLTTSSAIRIPLGTPIVDSGNIYMWNGSVWKQINNS